jgi:carboxyl-terminal processing protease
MQTHASSLSLALSACLAAAWLTTAAPAAGELRCESLPGIMDAFLKNHVVRHRLTEEIRQRVIETYLERFDPSRTLLLAGEMEALRGSMAGIFEEIQAGDCKRLTRNHFLLIDHHEAERDSVRKIAGAEDFEIDPSVTWTIERDQRSHAATKAKQAALLRSRIHFGVANYLSAGSTLEEAKQRLIRRYELRTKHLAEVDEEDLYVGFLNSFASSLDPHSSYLSTEVLEDFRISMSLSLEGIGVALSEQDGYAVAERIIPGGAADRHAVMRPKDKIIAVAQEGGEPVDIIDLPLRESVSLIRGKKGTRVGLTILRQGESIDRFTITIVRDTIDLAEQAAKLRFEQREVEGRKLKLAILELPSFYGDPDPSKRQCTKDVAELLRQVKQEKADGLLLDLSKNGGGLLPHAVTISGFFLRTGEIVAVEDAHGRRQELKDRDDEILYSGPLVVHTSRASASATEILAGALKDYLRAVIAGDEHTFGKGTVQTVVEYPRGRSEGAIKITTALFFRPGGKSTQHGGVEADVVIPSLLSRDDFGEKNQPYSLLNQVVTPFLGNSDNGGSDSERWRPISTETLAELSERSQRRIEASEEFAEIREALTKARENPGVVTLADILKRKEEEREEAEPEKGSDAPESNEEQETPDPPLEEAINVLADLVALTGLLEGEGAESQGTASISSRVISRPIPPSAVQLSAAARTASSRASGSSRPK